HLTKGLAYRFSRPWLVASRPSPWKTLLSLSSRSRPLTWHRTEARRNCSWPWIEFSSQKACAPGCASWGHSEPRALDGHRLPVRHSHFSARWPNMADDATAEILTHYLAPRSHG